MIYIVIYSPSKGLAVITVAMICHQAIQLGGWHWHKIVCITVDLGNNMSVNQMTELAIHKLERYPDIIKFIWSIHMITNDEFGKTPTKFYNVIDNIFKLFLQYECSQSKNIYT